VYKVDEGEMMILGVAPCFDQATSVSYKWFKELVKSLDENAVFPSEKWILLEKNDAVREKVEEEFDRLNPDWVVFYDHGVEDGLVQQGGDGYVIDLKNVGKFKGKAIYTMACLSAKILGKEHWRNGGIYWGYTEVFGFTIQEEELFMHAANAGLIYRFQGKSWEECLEYAKQQFNEAINKAKMLWTKIWLQHDRDNLVLYSPSHPPESECMFRKLVLKLFGRRGWKIRWAHVFFSIGYGIALHDFAHQTYELKGTVLSVEGGYVGFAIMLVTVLYLAAERRLWLRKRRWNYGCDKS
jgi:hypothetical protein